MPIIAVGSVHGSPGASALALDLARVYGGDALLIEADPDGGCLAARLDLAVRPGITDLAGAARVGISVDDLWKFAQPTSFGVAVIVAHPAAEQVQAALRAAVNHVGAAIRDSSGIVIVDVGRLRPGSPALEFAALAQTTLIVSANSAEAVVSLHHRAHLLRSVADPQIVLTSAKPYPADEVAETVGHPVWGVVPSDSDRCGRRRRTRQLHRLAALLASSNVAQLEVTA
jgi:hypothetical protein